jgi:choline-glycine betaine transporter
MPEKEVTKEERWYDRWQWWRMLFTITMGAGLLVVGVHNEDAAMMTVGAGLLGFSPAAKGP